MTIRFTCPSCGAEHDRGFIDGVCVFRCIACGYIGHGFHPDAEADRAVCADAKEADAINVSLGLPRDWPWGAGA